MSAPEIFVINHPDFFSQELFLLNITSLQLIYSGIKTGEHGTMIPYATGNTLFYSMNKASENFWF